MREFEVTLKWGQHEGTFISHGARTADEAVLAYIRMVRKNWRGPKPLRLSSPSQAYTIGAAQNSSAKQGHIVGLCGERSRIRGRQGGWNE